MKNIHKIFYLGLAGSNSYSAAIIMTKKIQLNQNQLFGLPSFEEIFHRVEKSDSAFGVVPIENSLSGSIYEIYDLLADSKTAITHELIIKINHTLLHRQKINLNKIRRCLSHPEVFRQCRRFFTAHPEIEKVAVADTASAAKMLKNASSDTAAIANSAAASANNLSIIKEHLEDNSQNFSRFITIGRKLNIEGNKVSLAFNLVHQPGSLFAALAPYAKWSLNLTKIESRPIQGKPWEYIFYVDFELNEKKHNLAQIIKEMNKITKNLKVLGRYDRIN